MAANESSPIMTTSQVTTNVTGPPTVTDPSSAPALYPPQGPDPAGTLPGAAEQMEEENPSGSQAGVGVEGEDVVWEARYSLRNFLGRIIARILLTVAWIALAIYTWGYSDGSLSVLTGVAGAVVALIWAVLIYRIVQARYGHYYRLTNRRLFVSTGLWRRRRDMLELLRVKDVYTRQTLLERWLSLGSVVVESSDRGIPTFYVTGVEDPKRVMDLVWHHARAERDRRSVKIDEV